MSLPVRLADAVSHEWRGRFLRGSAALGEEAITSDLVIALEERLSPWVLSVDSFSRAEEGGTRSPATGADLEIHFVAQGGQRHLGYRIQAKLAKTLYSPPTYTYDFKYQTASGTQQIDALIKAARHARCVPLYMLYNGPSAVSELLSATPYPRFRKRWQSHRGCWPYHDISLAAALTIATVPARLALREATLDNRKKTSATSVASYMSPWSCLFHQYSSANVSHPIRPGRSQLKLADLQQSLVDQLNWISFWAESVDTIEGLREEREAVLGSMDQELTAPDDVLRLWRGEQERGLDGLAAARPEAEEGAEGDSHLGAVMVIEVAE
jgi:hypothetical protein